MKIGEAQIGDRIRYVKDYGDYCMNSGDTGTVIERSPIWEHVVYVEADGYSGSYFWTDERDIEKES